MEAGMTTQERYSKVSRRIWDDERFRDKLSPIPPSAQGLFLRLLTAPECTVIPGLFRAHEGGLADSLGWSREQFRERFGELFREGMAKADWKAGLVWLPNAIKRDPPSNGNMVAGWAKEWNELPECGLKREAYQYLKRFLEGLGKGFSEPFAERWRNPSPNQEQEQEQEQEQDPPIAPQGASEPEGDPWGLTPGCPETSSDGAPSRTVVPKQTNAAIVRRVFEAWKLDTGHHRATLDPKRHRRIEARLREGLTEQDLLDAIEGRHRDPWLMGTDPKSPRVFDEIDTLFRDAAQIERLRDLRRNPPPPTLVRSAGQPRGAAALAMLTEEP